MKLSFPLLLAIITLLFGIVAIILTNTLDVNVESFDNNTQDSNKVINILNEANELIKTVYSQATELTYTFIQNNLASSRDLSSGHLRDIRLLLTEFNKLSPTNNNISNIISILKSSQIRAKQISDTYLNLTSDKYQNLSITDKNNLKIVAVAQQNSINNIKTLASTLTAENTTLAVLDTKLNTKLPKINLAASTQKGVIIIIVSCVLYLLHQLVLQKLIKNTIFNYVLSFIFAVSAIVGGSLTIKDFSKYDTNDRNFTVVKAFNIITGSLAILFGISNILLRGFFKI
jgi:hypothetical protein